MFPWGKIISTELYEMRVCLPLERYVKLGNIVQYEIDEWFVPLFTQEINEGLRGQGFPQFKGCQAILGERVIELIQN
jgi:hypothetical protein